MKIVIILVILCKQAETQLFIIFITRDCSFDKEKAACIHLSQQRLE